MFTTAQVQYRTKIPVQTIQRYIKDFADHFSETARVPNKGRRYVEADIQKLNVIRRMYQAKAQDEEIKAALADVTESPALPEFENVLQLVEAAHLAQINAEKSAQRAALFNHEILSRLGRYDIQQFEIKKRMDALETSLRRNEKTNAFILDELEAEGYIKKQKPQPVETQPPKQKESIAEKFQRGIDKVDKWVMDRLPDDETE